LASAFEPEWAQYSAPQLTVIAKRYGLKTSGKKAQPKALAKQLSELWRALHQNHPQQPQANNKRAAEEEKKSESGAPGPASASAPAFASSSTSKLKLKKRTNSSTAPAPPSCQAPSAPSSASASVSASSLAAVAEDDEAIDLTQTSASSLRSLSQPASSSVSSASLKRKRQPTAATSAGALASEKENHHPNALASSQPSGSPERSKRAKTDRSAKPAASDMACAVRDHIRTALPDLHVLVLCQQTIDFEALLQSLHDAGPSDPSLFFGFVAATDILHVLCPCASADIACTRAWLVQFLDAEGVSWKHPPAPSGAGPRRKPRPRKQ
jgi:hypothetical protein